MIWSSHTLLIWSAQSGVAWVGVFCAYAVSP
jgi:hypothetical protein